MLFVRGIKIPENRNPSDWLFPINSGHPRLSNALLRLPICVRHIQASFLDCIVNGGKVLENGGWCTLSFYKAQLASNLVDESHDKFALIDRFSVVPEQVFGIAAFLWCCWCDVH